MSAETTGAVSDPTAARSRFSAWLRTQYQGYLGILLVGSGARVFGLASQLVVLIILGRMLGKAAFGDLMAAFGFYRLAAVAIGTGASLVVLFHVSRRPRDKDFEVRLHRFSAMLAAVASAAIAVVGALSAPLIASALGKPGLEVWFQHLAPLAVFNSLLIITTGALEGRSRITHSIVIGEVAPNAVRIVLLPLVALLGLPDVYIAYVLTLSLLLPWLFSLPRLLDRSVRGLSAWQRWDYNYAGKFVVANLFAYQLASVDILVMSVLFSSETVGDYAIAARIAALFSFFQLAILKQFAPRAGEIIAKGDMAALRSEVEACRRMTIGCGALTIGGILIVAPYLLPLFGNFAGALGFLTLLAIPCFVQSFYATSDRLLIIGGHPNVALTLTASSFAALTIAPFVTAPWLGPIAVPAAMIASAILFNPIVAVRVRQLFGIHTITLPDLALMACGAVMLGISAVSGSRLWAVGACAVLCLIGVTMLGTAIWRSGLPLRARGDARSA
ncbi:MAG: oligosaccharide flippase family protein [Alphaproteobacteria bacterium]